MFVPWENTCFYSTGFNIGSSRITLFQYDEAKKFLQKHPNTYGLFIFESPSHYVFSLAIWNVNCQYIFIQRTNIISLLLQDYEGQKLAERLFHIIILFFGVSLMSNYMYCLIIRLVYVGLWYVPCGISSIPRWSNFRGSADFTPFSFPEPLVLTFMYLDEKNDENFFFFWLIEQVLI